MQARACLRQLLKHRKDVLAVQPSAEPEQNSTAFAIVVAVVQLARRGHLAGCIA